jgi:hypothetical protein
MSDRDTARIRRAETFAAAKALGINLDEERQAGNLDQRGLAVRAGELISSSVPHQDRQRLVRDSPPQGTFDGVNQTFTLSGVVWGLNIVVDYVNFATGVHTPLTRTDNPVPGAGTFYFNVDTPTQIVVGTPPQSGDALVATFLTI